MSRKSEKPDDGQCRDRLSRSGLADQRQRASALQREGDAIHRFGFSLALAEQYREIADIEQGRRHHPRSKVLRGSNASRTASPVNTKSDSMIAMTMNPARPSQGACRLDLPCSSSSPSDGEPGGKPNPRKS